MLRKAIRLLGRTIDEMKDLAMILRQSGLPIRADYRDKEIKRLRRILDLLELENDKELDRRGLR